MSFTDVKTVFQLGTMSPRSLKAAGMSTIRETKVAMPISVITSLTPHTSVDSKLLTSTPVPKSSLSPTNTSSLLDISLLSGNFY